MRIRRSAGLHMFSMYEAMRDREGIRHVEERMYDKASLAVLRVIAVKASGIPLLMVVLSNAALILLLAWTSFWLPDRVASHFDASGIAGGWTSRAIYLWTTGALGCGLSAAIVILFYSIRYFPDSGINLPHREHWLAQERRSETYSAILRFGAWLACLMVFFVFGMHLLVISANVGNPPRMSESVWLLVGGLAVAIGIWTYLLVHRFAKVQ